MIELTEQQMQALENPEATPPCVVNPRTKETFVLLRVDEYKRLKEDEYDDSPWTSEELHALAWEAGKHAGGRTWTSTTISRRSHEPGRRDPGPLPAPVWAAGKKRPAVIVQSDAYAGAVSTLVVAEVTKNLTMAGDPACLFIDANTPEGKATGLVRDSVVSCLVLVTVYADTVAQVLGTLSPTMNQKLNDCLKAGLGIP